MDALKEQTVQGPYLDAVYERQTVRVSDMAAEQADAVRGLGVPAGAGGMPSCQPYMEGDDLGALNLYAHEAGLGCCGRPDDGGGGPVAQREGADSTQPPTAGRGLRALAT